MIGRVILFAVAAIALVAVVLFSRGAPFGGGSGEVLVDVAVPRLTDKQMQGETAFEMSCASCHGVNAAGKDGFGPPLVHKFYEPSHHGDMAFVLAVKQGVREHHWKFGNMPPVARVSDQEIQSIIAFVRALQRANGIQ